jgi:hypothetical protein
VTDSLSETSPKSVRRVWLYTLRATSSKYVVMVNLV